MSLSIENKKENAFLGRTEITGIISFSGTTPKKEEVTQMIASKEGVDQNLIVIPFYRNIYGTQTAKVSAYLYKTVEDKTKVEHQPKKAAGAAAADPAKK